MRAYAVISMANGRPDLGGLPCYGYTLLAHLPNYSHGVYLVSGTAAQLTAINALAQVYRICTLAELDDVITAARRTRINEWLTARGYPNIPAGWTYRQVLDAIAKRLLPHFVRERNDVADPDADYGR